MELLAQTFMGIDLADDDRVKIVVKPLKMENGANFKVERVSVKAHLALTIQIWDGSLRHCGIEVAPTATMAEILGKAQEKINDEPLEEARHYNVYFRNQLASPPWIQKEYVLRPNVEASGTETVKCRNGNMIVPVPLLQKARW
jgi:hypothetical protein